MTASRTVGLSRFSIGDTMKWFVFCIVSVVILLGVVSSTSAQKTDSKLDDNAAAIPTRAEALTAIKKLGGHIEEEGTPPRRTESFLVQSRKRRR